MSYQKNADETKRKERERKKEYRARKHQQKVLSTLWKQPHTDWHQALGRL